MSYCPGDTINASFTTESAGVPTDADATPAVAVRRNGTDDVAITVTVTRNDVGDYTAVAALPLTYSGGDDVELVASFTISAVAGKSLVRLGKLDRTAQTLARVLHRSSQVHFVSLGGDPSYDGFSPQTAKALPSEPAAGPGDTIVVFSGTYALDTAVVDLSADNVNGVHLVGNGIGTTILTSNALLGGPGCIVKPGNGSQVSDMTIQGLAAILGSTDQFQAPFGASASQSPFTFATARRLNLIADSDGFYVNQASTPAVLWAFDCLVQTAYNGIDFNSPGGQADLENCDLIVNGPSTCDGGQTSRPALCEAGTLNIRGGSLSSQLGQSIAVGAQTVGTGILNLDRVRIFTAGSPLLVDLDSGGTAMSISDLAYRSGQVQGPIASLNTLTTLDPAQVFDNSGQVTPQPAMSGFSGGFTITFQFVDAASAPVGGVVFSVVGLGSAVADSSGACSVAMPGGAFTLKALPTSGTLFPDTSGNVTVDATITITGTAVVIPAPSSPDQTTGYLTTRDGQGNLEPNVQVTFQLVDPHVCTDSFDQTTFTAMSDSSSLLQVSLLKSTLYQARVGGGSWVAFTSGNGPSFQLPEILGTYA